MSVVLHIGLQKTGTSSIQNFLQSNIAVLNENGFDYPHITQFSAVQFKGPSSHNCLAPALGLKQSGFPAVDEDELQSLREFLLSTDKTVIISSEEISRIMDLTTLMKFFEGMDVKVFVYLRHQANWAESMYNQRNKLLFFKQDERLFEEGTLSEEDLFRFLRQEHYTPLMNFEALLDRWSEAFGQENLIVRIFDRKKMYKNDLLADFCQAIGIDFLEECTIPKSVNENLANSWISYFVKLSQDQGPEFAKQAAESFINGLDDPQIVQNGDIKVLTPRVRKNLMKDFRDFNRATAQKYFGRNNLFGPE